MNIDIFEAERIWQWDNDSRQYINRLTCEYQISPSETMLYGVKDKDTNEIIVQPIYVYLNEHDVIDNYICAFNGDKWGLIDLTNGNEINFIYDSICAGNETFFA